MPYTEKYIDWDYASSVVGVSAAGLTDDVKDAIIQEVEWLMIDSILGGGMSFDKVYEVDSAAPELHSIGLQQSFIILKKFPVVSVTRLRDNIRSSVSVVTLTEGVDFEVNKDTGVINLVNSEQGSLANVVSFFTKGHSTVDVSYVYGFSSVPNDIKAFANLLAAKSIKSWYLFDNGDVSGSFTMGDYTEKVGEWSRQLADRFGPTISMALSSLKAKYSNIVPIGTTSVRI